MKRTVVDMMKRHGYKFIYCIMLCPALSMAFGNKTLFVPRSQSVDAARELMGWQREIHRYDVGRHYWSLSLTPEYMRAFRYTDIIDYILGGRDSFVFSGSRVAMRGANDLLADYFGLPADFQSMVCFKPRITNFIFDIDFYMGLDPVLCGLYFRIHAPIVHAKWDLHLFEQIKNAGTAYHPAGYMAATQVPRSDLATSVEFALQGIRAQVEVDETDPDFTDLIIDTAVRTPLVYGDMHDPLKFGQVGGRLNETRLSDVQFIVGWDFLQDSWYHFGLNIRSAVPTGNKPCAQFLFEPLIGNAHWELGFGISSHVNLWESSDGLQQWALYFDANFTHLFTSQQRRSFEFKNNGKGNRYMLVEEIEPAYSSYFVDGTAASLQYNQHLFPAINETTLCMKVRIPIQADMVLKAAFYHKGFEVDFGYNLWIRSAERLVCRDALVKNLALKGDAQLYGFDAITEVPTALNATQDSATLKAGQGVTNFVAGRQFANDNADSPGLASNPAVLNQLTAADSAALSMPLVQVQGSITPLVLTDTDIDDSSALSPRGITHKLFLDFSHRWVDCGNVIPFLGIGFEVEFGPHHFDVACNNSFGLSQYGILFKGGFSY